MAFASAGALRSSFRYVGRYSFGPVAPRRCIKYVCRMIRPSVTLAGVNGPVDPAVFEQRWRVFALNVPPKLVQGTVRALKDHVLRVPRVAAVAKPTSAQSARVVLLRYFAVTPTDAPLCPKGNMKTNFAGNAEALVSELHRANLGAKVSDDVEELVRNVTKESLTESVVEVGYEHWSSESVLGHVLPPGTVIPTAYESVGHIAHVNLRPEHEPYKSVIAAVLLDKLGPRVRTVVNKTENTGGPYRTFAMEVLAGEQNLETSQKENSCTFLLDFSKVYWNSRLETEHRRIVDSLHGDDVLADAFCGIGPFVIPSRRLRKCRVFANDLNPSSIEYLKKSAVKNGISVDGNKDFNVSCGCARDFLRRVVREDHVPITRVVMNFPSGAPEFLDVFRGLYVGVENENGPLPMPTVNCYCFARGDNWKKDATHRVRAALGLREGDEEINIDIREVRDVAPKKVQVCATFKLPEFVAYRSESEICASRHAPAEQSTTKTFARETKRQKV